MKGDEQLLNHHWRPGLGDKKTLTKLKLSELLREPAKRALMGISNKVELKPNAAVWFLCSVYGQALIIFSPISR